ncbi:FkbM family methyltransferase [Jannaschia sp. Os4]|uniref:FkbM family methyltransferase n=1 Tax=Jannaschia sp. Os4 TaxID=2807617 RepID=UPI001939BB69|nr:FkbM family methyltransferase [Jannaschia sp. Os4]MBM2575810.1 FkbM family methyltransferase [Jannaschia sp. Os4]
MLWAGTGLKTRLMQRGYLWMHEKREGGAARYAPHGVEVRVDDRADLALRHVLARGAPYEEAEALLIRRHLGRGTAVIELGACIGIVSALIRDVIGPSAPHVLVEANPRTASLAKENAARGASVRAVRLVRGAVSYGAAETVRFVAGRNQHAGRLARSDEDGFEAPAVRLSGLVERVEGARYALVCDIEGAELAMVRADPDALERCDLVIMEMHPGAYPKGMADQRDIERQLAEAGLHEVERIADVVAFARG